MGWKRFVKDAFPSPRSFQLRMKRGASESTLPVCRWVWREEKEEVWGTAGGSGGSRQLSRRHNRKAIVRTTWSQPKSLQLFECRFGARKPQLCGSLPSPLLLCSSASKKPFQLERVGRDRSYHRAKESRAGLQMAFLCTVMLSLKSCPSWV